MTQELLDFMLKMRFRQGFMIGLAAGYALASVVTCAIFAHYWPAP